jgi:serine/threonine protein kinase
MRACIADFGLATLTDSGCGTTLVGSAIMGTPRWLAPELIPHAPDAPDAQVKRHHTYASDIYAFALVCYEASCIPSTSGTPSNSVLSRLDVFRQSSI